jgi:hypothetical protein
VHRPQPSEFAPYYGKYVELVPETDIVNALDTQMDETLAVLRTVSEATSVVRHPPYTWSVKEVIGHLTDCERIFGYRALRFARGDTTSLPGFEENDYARTGEFDRVPLRELAAEFEAVRRSTIALFKHLPETAWSRGGQANEKNISVRAIAYVIIGHARHHTAILRQRLGPA